MLAWIDRVESEFNQVDGISPKDFGGSWQRRRIHPPGDSLPSLQECVSNRPSGHEWAFKP